MVLLFRRADFNEVCNELQTLDSQGVIGGYNLNQAKNANTKWCKYDAARTDADENFVYLEIRLRVVRLTYFLV